MRRRFSAEKYCSLVEQEGGLSLLEEIINSNDIDQEDETAREGGQASRPYPRVVELASMVRDNVSKWRREKDAAEQLDG